jgi:dTDP-glucose 4,6-dehydratase
LDKLTYCGNLENLSEIDSESNYTFVHGDICNQTLVADLSHEFGITDIIHLAAESHVDRSVKDPSIFAQTNVMGTLNLLNVAKEFWNAFPTNCDPHRFHHVSTDEVYGSLSMDPNDKFKETTPYDPHSPYSASKAASDMFVKAYGDTYGMDITISNCSNNYGPNQFPEKLIPLVINNLKNGKKIPIYGEGLNVRDWLYVQDHVDAIDLIFHNGRKGETYNIGGNQEKFNIDIVKTLIDVFNKITDNNIQYEDAIEHIADPRGGGHDLRYAIDATKILKELGWQPKETFDSGIEKTVRWYLDNEKWLENIVNGEYKDYYKKFYKEN